MNDIINRDGKEKEETQVSGYQQGRTMHLILETWCLKAVVLLSPNHQTFLPFLLGTWSGCTRPHPLKAGMATWHALAKEILAEMMSLLTWNFQSHQDICYFPPRTRSTHPDEFWIPTLSPDPGQLTTDVERELMKINVCWVKKLRCWGSLSLQDDLCTLTEPRNLQVILIKMPSWMQDWRSARREAFWRGCHRLARPNSYSAQRCSTKKELEHQPPPYCPLQNSGNQVAFLYASAHLLSPEEGHWVLTSPFVTPIPPPSWFTCVVAPSKGRPRAVIFPQVSKVPVTLVLYQAQDLLTCEGQRMQRS